jgi:2-polyprenyl-3-methyl-5-hydroxy-6-metoxy-1,4-benzoquinol methylase
VIAISEKLIACLLCGSSSLNLVVPLRPMPIATPNFELTPELANDPRIIAGVPLDLWLCDACGHVQVGEIGNPDLQYRNYVYTTSLSLGLREHFARYCDDTLARLRPAAGSLVVEIGSNDGTLLKCFQARGMRVLGLDPATEIAREATAAGIETLPEFFSASLARKLRESHGPAAIVIANNVIANVPDMGDFGQGVAALLDDEGAFVFETQYGADVIERCLLDTVYHEHISYFFIDPTQQYMLRHGLELADVERIATKGGSFRATAVRREGSRPCGPAVEEMIREERRKGCRSQPYFDQLNETIAGLQDDLRSIVDAAQSRGHAVGGYGVSVGTTALLPQFGVTKDIEFLVDDDPKKPPRVRGADYSIPVIGPAALIARAPATVVIFAWRYADPIISKHRQFLERGGRFVVPFPEMRVVDLESASAGPLKTP